MGETVMQRAGECEIQGVGKVAEQQGLRLPGEVSVWVNQKDGYMS
ncbi:MAG: hypothetical protein OEY28_01090 [Nitrospira sp.]|nr:hypothetical protein [Nitrospira sp.]